MGTQVTIVDASSPQAIATAIKTVNQTPGLRIEPGIRALWALYNAPGHSLPRTWMEQQFGAFDLHFGWLCRRVAELLGSNDPDALALVDYSKTDDGTQLLTLKPAVVAALALGQKHPKLEAN